MDYPPPRVRLTPNGEIDISEAYGIGPGAYDVWALRWGYGIFPPETERDSLRALISDGLKNGFLFLSDADARPEYASDPRTNLWDDAATADEFLRRQMAVRRVAMQRFGERNIRLGEPIALLQERFVPVYFMHRFAINSLAKTIGGMEYSNAVRGDNLQATKPISGERQRAALAALVAALRPGNLAIPDTVVTLLAPRPFGYEGSIELFGSRTRPAFDELGAARTLAQMIADAVLQRDRAGRLVQQALHERAALALAETIDSLTATWRASGRAPNGSDGLSATGCSLSPPIRTHPPTRGQSPTWRSRSSGASRRRRAARRQAHRRVHTGWRSPATSRAGRSGANYRSRRRPSSRRLATRSDRVHDADADHDIGSRRRGGADRVLPGRGAGHRPGVALRRPRPGRDTRP